MKPVYLVGANGDTIDLCTPSIFVAPGARFGTTQLAVSYRNTRYGRRVQRLDHDLVRSEFTIRVHSTDETTLDGLRSRVVNALRSRTGRTRVMLIVERGDGRRRAQTGIDVGLDPVHVSTQATSAQIPVVLESVDDPYWLDLEAAWLQTTIGVAGSTPWVGEMPIGANVPIGWPWSIGGYFIADANAQTMTFSNNGPLPTWPIWTITGPATSVELAHERTGRVWKWVGALAVGETLRIVTDPKTGRTVEKDAQPAWSGVTVDSQMSEFLPGPNRVQIRLLGGTDPDSTVKATWHARHASP